MTFAEVYPAFKQGRGVRRSSWVNPFVCYSLIKDGKTVFMDYTPGCKTTIIQETEAHFIENIIANDWELYQDPFEKPTQEIKLMSSLKEKENIKNDVYANLLKRVEVLEKEIKVLSIKIFN